MAMITALGTGRVGAACVPAVLAASVPNQVVAPLLNRPSASSGSAMTRPGCGSRPVGAGGGSVGGATGSDGLEDTGSCSISVRLAHLPPRWQEKPTPTAGVPTRSETIPGMPDVTTARRYILTLSC